MNNRLVSLMLLVLGLALTFVAEAQVSATLDRVSIVEGESVTLTLSSQDQSAPLSADYSVLEEQFFIENVSQQSFSTFNNGRQTSESRLVLQIRPRSTGTLEIPAIEVNGTATEPVSLTVAPAPPIQAGEPQPAYLEVSIEPASQEVYVNSQLSLVVRLLYLGSMPEARLDDPRIEHAAISRINESRFTAPRHDLNYQGLERRYAIFPERSGELVIPPLTFSGRLVLPQNSIWQAPGRRGRRVNRTSDEIIVTVKPRPPAFTAPDWLPARILIGDQDISLPAGELHVGEPVTRTIQIAGLGIIDTMLPELNWPDFPGARVYPDAPQRVTRVDSGGVWLRGQATYRYAVVPTEPGLLELPEIRLPWWDSVADEAKELIIPAETVQVLPSLTAGTEAVPVGDIPVAGPASSASTSLWKSIALALAAGWLISLLVWWRMPGLLGRGKQEQEEASHQSVSAETAMKALRKACQANDAAAASTALRQWAQSSGYGALTATSIAPELKEVVTELDRVRYSQDGSGDWNGEQFWQVFSRWSKLQAASRNTVRPSDAQTLPPLYPE